MFQLDFMRSNRKTANQFRRYLFYERLFVQQTYSTRPPGDPRGATGQPQRTAFPRCQTHSKKGRFSNLK